MQDYVLISVMDTFLKKVLLVKKDRPAWQKGFYNLPGGKIEEESSYEAAQRELKEETGIEVSIDDLYYTGCIHLNCGRIYVYSVIYDGDVSIQDGETEVPEWISIGDIKNYPLIPNLYKIIPYLCTYVVFNVDENGNNL